MNTSTELTIATRGNVVPFRVVQGGISSDTISCLRHMLAEAEAGRIVGMTFGALQSDREFYVANCGEAHRDPAMNAAMASAITYQAMKRVFGDD